MRQWFERAVAGIRQPRWDRRVAIALLMIFAVARSGSFEERDPYWEARAGVENLNGAPLLRPDTWSWSGVTGDWYQNSPLWNDILGASWLAGGFWGIFVTTVLLIGGYLLLSFALSQLLGGRALPSMIAVLLTVSPALSMLSPRGTLIVEVLILGAVGAAVLIAKAALQQLPTAVLAGLIALGSAAWSVLGNWLHLSFLMIGPAMAAVLAPVWWFAPWRLGRRLAVILVSAVGWCVGPVLSPYGLLPGLAHSQEVARICEGLILEWVSPFSESSKPVFWLMALAAVAVAAGVSWWLIDRLRRGDRSPELGGLVALSLVGVPAALAGLTAIRFLGIALLTLAPVAGAAAAAAVDALRHRIDRIQVPARRAAWTERASGDYWRPLLAAAAVVLLPWAIVLGSNHAVPQEARFVAALPRDCRLFAPGGLAATSILTRPDVTVWIDGRADFYGREHLLLTYAYFAQRTPRLVPEAATCLLMDKDAEDSRGLAAALALDPAWRIIAVDDHYAVWVPNS